MFRQAPFAASSPKPVWGEVFRQLAEVHHDPRALDDASSLAADYTTLFGRTVMSRWMQSKLEKVADACPPDDAARAARCSGSTRRVSPR
jgi:hypothetical protein